MKKLLLILPLVFLFCFTFSCQQGEEVAEEVAKGERLPIIDVHVHAYAVWQGEEKPDWFPKDVYLPKTDEEFTKMTFEMFERCNIVRAMVSGDPLWVDKWRKTSPIKIIPGWANNIVGNSQEDFKSLERKIIDGRIEVIGEIGAQYMGLVPNDSLLEPYYALAEKLDVPFAIHMGPGPSGIAFRGFPQYRMRNGKPLLLEDVLLRHPKLRLYVMHAGWPFVDEMVALMFFYPNVYVDIGGSWTVPRAEFHSCLRRMVEAGFGKRIMFGSDQMLWPDGIELAIESVESAKFLTEEQKRDIFYNNAKRFFRLE